MRYGRVGSCALTSAASMAATARKATRMRVMAGSGGGRFPVGAAGGHGERDAAEEHECRERDERALVAPEDDEDARDERAHGVAEALEQAIDAVHRVVAVDADLVDAVLGHQRALRGDRERLPEAEQEHDAEEHEEAVREEQQQAREP